MAYGQRDPHGKGGWRARYKRPDGTYGSESGFTSKKSAKNWGEDQEALIRRNMWIDPHDGNTPFEDFASVLLDSIGPRLEPSTLAGTVDTGEVQVPSGHSPAATVGVVATDRDLQQLRGNREMGFRTARRLRRIHGVVSVRHILDDQGRKDARKPPPEPGG
ncbi:hypothetical protein [Saccharopolyspora phatthalungensis]|uniref:Uncharacterized protein n=1 Tax=Saccharopolyspora phatthalungensis TaxID=664693 RepID=A0A840Q613_9PSEU|nr:hypothetical protein [Saccharopolyspora phatthalungensis]MBB5156064.1 hypothetical protein [Saccharopolyspora phatthalungensis]